MELVARTHRMELWRGCLTLLQGWLGGCTQPEVLEVVVHRLRKSGRFPEETLVIIDEGLTAVISAETATSWRQQRQLESISGIEVAAWLHATWLVADLIDMSRGKGTVINATLGALMELAEKANEGNGRCGFCDVHQDQANLLIAGAGVYICDRCVSIQLVWPLPHDLDGDDRRCQFCGHGDRPMALGANARICELCLHVGHEMVRERRKDAAGLG